MKLQTKYITAAAVVVAAVGAAVAAFASWVAVTFPLVGVAVTVNITLAVVLVLPFCSFWFESFRLQTYKKSCRTTFNS